jgi:HlyD family secretion protein
LAKSAILQATAALENSKANLEYTDITAPVDGVVIDRKIDPGQTLAAQFQTPELFIVAPDLRAKVHVFASVNEAYIGLIQQAKIDGRPVEFTVEAHPEELFAGEIEQIRVSSTAEQTVVTYPVVIAAANPDLKLLPGMTATISFEVDATEDVVKIPNEALRFYPSDAKLVRPEDRKLLDSSRWTSTGFFEEVDSSEEQRDEELTASEKTKAHRDNNKRHVWVDDGEFLKAIEVETGLSDMQFTELVSGELEVGDELVTGKKD